MLRSCPKCGSVDIPEHSAGHSAGCLDCGHESTPSEWHAGGLRSRARLLAVLKVLLCGGRICDRGQTYVLSDQLEVCVVGTTDSGEERCMPVLGMGLPEFIAWASKISDGDAYIAVGEMVLTEGKEG